MPPLLARETRTATVEAAVSAASDDGFQPSVSYRAAFLSLLLLPFTAPHSFAEKQRVIYKHESVPAKGIEHVTYLDRIYSAEARSYVSFVVPYVNASHGLECSIITGQHAIFTNNIVSARLHLPDGRVVAPSTDSLTGGIGIGNAGTTTWSGMVFFPWNTNALAEGWVEMSVGKEHYWIEIPYGLTYKPQPGISARSTNGPPAFAPAMRDLGKDDHVLHWTQARYDLGPIQNGWRIELVQSNGAETISEVILYREDSHAWSLETPRTALRVATADGKVFTARQVSVVPYGDFMRRRDTFKLDIAGDNVREWGEIQVDVDDKTYRMAVPSSMYKRGHGVAPDRK